MQAEALHTQQVRAAQEELAELAREHVWQAFGMPDSLQHADADKAYLPPGNGYQGELNDLFSQRAARKVREY